MGLEVLYISDVAYVQRPIFGMYGGRFSAYTEIFGQGFQTIKIYCKSKNIFNVITTIMVLPTGNGWLGTPMVVGNPNGWLGTKKFPIFIWYAVTRLRGYAYGIVCLITPSFHSYYIPLSQFWFHARRAIGNILVKK